MNSTTTTMNSTITTMNSTITTITCECPAGSDSGFSESPFYLLPPSPPGSESPQITVMIRIMMIIFVNNIQPPASSNKMIFSIPTQEGSANAPGIKGSRSFFWML